MANEVETPSSQQVSPLPAAQSQSRGNLMTSPKSSIRSPIRSRRSRRNRAANRINREEGVAGAQEASSPSVATSQSQTFTNHDNWSLLMGNQCPDNNQHQLAHRFHSRKPA